MNKLITFMTFIMLIFGFLGRVGSAAGPMQIANQHKVRIVNFLNSPDWERRAEGLALITDDDLKDEEIRVRLISLLENENQYVNSPAWQVDFPGESFESWWNSYYKKLVGLVGRARDERALPVLIDIAFSNSGGPNLVKQHLAELGEPAARILLDALDDPHRSISAIIALQAVMQRENNFGNILSDEVKLRIKEEMIVQVESGRLSNRDVAVRVLGEFEDAEVIEYLQYLAKNDPNYIEREINGKKVRTYYIREEAQKQLDKHKRE